jgi:hypothetical protein
MTDTVEVSRTLLNLGIGKMVITKASSQATQQTYELINDLIAAVRAETLREVRGVVEGMESLRIVSAADEYFGRDGLWCVDKESLLAALDALAHPEGTDK